MDAVLAGQILALAEAGGKIAAALFACAASVAFLASVLLAILIVDTRRNG